MFIYGKIGVVRFSIPMMSIGQDFKKKPNKVDNEKTSKCMLLWLICCVFFTVNKLKSITYIVSKLPLDMFWKVNNLSKFYTIIEIFFICKNVNELIILKNSNVSEEKVYSK